MYGDTHIRNDGASLRVVLVLIVIICIIVLIIGIGTDTLLPCYRRVPRVIQLPLGNLLVLLGGMKFAINNPVKPTNICTLYLTVSYDHQSPLTTYLNHRQDKSVTHDVKQSGMHC